MKRFQSAFAAPSGFVLAAKATKAGRRGDVARPADAQPSIPAAAKTRTRDSQTRAA